MHRGRVLLASLTVAVLYLGLVGCSGGDGHTSASSHRASVDSKFGRVDVPDDPRRVVALGWGDAEVALALGVQPVGAADWLGFGAAADGVGPWAQGLYRKPPVLLGTTELDARAIAALHPDLILDTRDSGEQARYEVLNKIAPTVGVPRGADNFQTSTEQQVTTIALALGRVDAGTQLLADLHTTFTDAAAAHHDFAQHTATAAAYSNNGWALYAGADPRARFLADLGFEETPFVQQLPATPRFVPTTDQTTRIADVMVSFAVFVAPHAITRQPGYRGLAPVQEGHAIVVHDQQVAQAFDIATPASLEFALEHLLPALTRATPQP